MLWNHEETKSTPNTHYFSNLGANSAKLSRAALNYISKSIKSYFNLKCTTPNRRLFTLKVIHAQRLLNNLNLRLLHTVRNLKPVVVC